MRREHAADGEVCRLVCKAEHKEGNHAVHVEVPLAIGSLGEKARHEHKERHMEEVYHVECRAERKVIVVNGMHEVACDHKDDEHALDVIE